MFFFLFYVSSLTCLWLWFLPMMIVFYTGVDDNTSVEKDKRP